MKKGIVIAFLVIAVAGVGATHFFGGCVGKARVDVAPPDVTITNTYQLKDISKNEMIRDEARQRLITVLQKHNLTPDGDVKFVRVAAYKPFRNHHHLLMEFTLKLVGRTGLYHSFAYLDVEETSGQYKVAGDFFNISVRPESNERYKESYKKALQRVNSAGGVLTVSDEN